jgi:hypothetical protein
VQSKNVCAKFYFLMMSKKIDKVQYSPECMTCSVALETTDDDIAIVLSVGNSLLSASEVTCNIEAALPAT